ncbi:MAG: DNA polymerase III subunit chi [Oceanicoccus sp.]|uniref:DNA polymerase III subunit chi n=1 Tax=Oceanicoccus sp. TaxID=2691044 RepID=UPI00260365C2|nr:DNA polymerase III subunit chi [Oceanicoccus sp.]MCP3907382.1 DNA polymerase III subunit chi [Oceanicoccus sp.]MDG1771900.1 DNA polymerase III subunit chi [Oceanicoccus sp.]
MTKVDFYILGAESSEQRQLFACRLAEKAFKLGHSIYIHSEDQAQANALDQLLWSWRNSSFVPHQLETKETDSNAQGLLNIGFNRGQGSSTAVNGLLINLSPTVPEFFSRFERVSEIVVQSATVIESTRSNYRFYRDRGYPLENHDLRK